MLAVCSGPTRHSFGPVCACYSLVHLYTNCSQHKSLATTHHTSHITHHTGMCIDTRMYIHCTCLQPSCYCIVLPLLDCCFTINASRASVMRIPPAAAENNKSKQSSGGPSVDVAESGLNDMAEAPSHTMLTDWGICEQLA